MKDITIRFKMGNCKLCNKELGEQNKSGLCKICYSRDYRKRNKDKIKPVAKKKYLRRREYFNQKVKEWHSKNRDKNNRTQNEYYHNHKERQLIRVRTQNLFGHLKVRCQECGSIDDLQFHHPEPLRVDNFKILCKNCHMKEHNKIPIKSSELNN